MAILNDKLIEGTFKRNDKGFGFIRFDENSQDAYVAPDNTLLALSGDVVQAEIIRPAKDDRGPDAKIVKIVEHSQSTVVGTFKSEVRGTDIIGTIVSNDIRLKDFQFLVDSSGIKPEDGDIVVSTTKEYPTKTDPKKFVVIATQTLGKDNQPGIDILQIVTQNKIPVDFSIDTQDEVKKIPTTINVDEALAEGRIDLREQPLITIDGADTKDIDDAVVVRKMDNGNYHLGVHIADVSHYVQQGTALDEDAYQRGTSVYLTDRVIPMLPKQISNGIASLNPYAERLAMSCEMEIDSQGNVANHKIFTSIIQSHGAITYAAVNKILKNDQAEIQNHQEFVPMIQAMGELHNILYKARNRRGAIEFETDEAYIKVDANGKPIDIELRTRDTAEKLIESFMLAANETVAEHFDKLKVPFLYRIHETPDGERVTAFFEFMKTIGHPINADTKDLKSTDFQRALDSVTGTPEEMMIRTMMLRSMKQARYATDPVGHFGIGAEYYTHFTSPIRRYPDLTVHRLIKYYQEHNNVPENAGEMIKDLKQVGVDTSDYERRAVDAEREVDDMKKAEYMESHIGETYDGVINSALKFGLFVSLPNTVEGLVHISNMKDDVYDYDEQHAALIGRGNHRIFAIGQSVKVRVTRANKEDHKIDFELIDPQSAPKTDIKVKVKDDRQRKFKEQRDKKKFDGKKG